MSSARPAPPLGTLAVLAAAALATAWPVVAAATMGERSALAAGELWRAWSAHLAHFSWSHLLWSGLVWLAAGSVLEREDRRAWLLTVLLVAPAVTILALLLDPDLARYGGLSGLATVPLVTLALRRLFLPSPRLARFIAAVLLTAVTIKLIHEFASPDRAPLLAAFSLETGPVRSAPYAHLTGALGGLVLALSALLRPRVFRPRAAPWAVEIQSKAE